MNKVFTTVVNEKLSDKDLDVIAWAEKSLSERKDFRDNYREFIELSLIFMRFTPPRCIYFMGTGPMHYVRWMSKVLYSLKIWIFHKQFKVTVRKKRTFAYSCFGNEDLLQTWIEAPIPPQTWVEAPIQ